MFSSQPPLSCPFSAFLAGFWGMGQTPACWLKMNELQGTHGLGGVSSEKLSISGLILLCWPGPEPCPVAYVALLSTLFRPFSFSQLFLLEDEDQREGAVPLVPASTSALPGLL